MSGPERASRIPHVTALDGARGVAVAGVVLFHGGHLQGGYLGVDFFFTLSGFLITSLLLAEARRTGGVRLGGFWSRRARRLLPAIGVLMCGIALYSVFLASPQQLEQIRGDALATLTYTANWHEIFGHYNYFALFSAPSPLNHTWSLAIEEQFYLIWPLVFVGLLAWWKRAAPQAVLVTSLVLAGVSTALMFALYAPDVSRDYYGTDTRATAILLGAALAAWIAIHGPTERVRARIALEVFALLGVVVLAIAWTRLSGVSPTLFHGGFLVCGLAATALIAAAVHPTRGPVAWALSWRPLCALGLISYGVYLYHWPIDVAFDQQEMHFGGWPLFGFQTALVLVVAYLSYRFIEMPVRRGALTSVQWRKLTPAITVAVVVLLVAATSGARSTPADANPAGATHSAFTYPTPQAAIRDATRAARTSPRGARRVLVVGDSVGYFLAESFQSLRTRPRLTVLNSAYPGCSFFPKASEVRYRTLSGTTTTFPTSNCNPSWQSGVISKFRPNLVLWLVSNPADAFYAGGHWVRSCSADYVTAYERRLHQELATLASQGAKVVITTEVYPRYVDADADRQTDCDNTIRRRVALRTGVQLVDLQRFICPRGKCREKKDGITLRVDGEHFEGAGGRLVAGWILDHVRRATHHG